MRLELEFEQLKRQRSSSQDTHVEQQAGAQDPGEPKKPKSKLVLDTARAQGLSEREFRDRLNRLKENPLFQKLKRLSVIRGKYRKGEIEKDDIDEIIMYKSKMIAETTEELGITDGDYKEFFSDPGGGNSISTK